MTPTEALERIDILGLIHRCPICKEWQAWELSDYVPRRGDGALHLRFPPSAMMALLEEQRQEARRLFGIDVQARSSLPKVEIQGPQDSEPRCHTWICEGCYTKAETAAAEGRRAALKVKA